MAIDQKMRSLFCGLPQGLYQQELDGETVIYLADVPYELEGIILAWIDALPRELVELDSPNTLFRQGEKKALAITSTGAEHFITWMLQTLVQAKHRPGFKQHVRDVIEAD